MFNENMKETTRALKTALPFSSEGTSGRAVLLLHGYNGYPGDMIELARRLAAEGYTVSVPRLPGHGTDSRDFRRSGWRDWLCCARNAYIDLSSRYENVSLSGLSMGGILSLLIAAEFRPEKLVLLAPAMAVARKVFYLTPLLKYLVPVMKRGWNVERESDGDRKVLAREYWSHYYTAQIAELNRLMMMARRKLDRIDCPVYVMLSETDPTVPLQAGRVIKAGLNVPYTEFVLKNSPHVIFDGPEKDIAVEQVLKWMSEK